MSIVLCTLLAYNNNISYKIKKRRVENMANRTIQECDNGLKKLYGEQVKAVYAVIETGETLEEITIYDTAEEAIYQAELAWDRLTATEKKTWTVQAAITSASKPMTVENGKAVYDEDGEYAAYAEYVDEDGQPQVTSDIWETLAEWRKNNDGE
jgi:hypothetical protein